MVTFITGADGNRQRVKLTFAHEQFAGEAEVRFPNNLVMTDSGRIVEANARTTAFLINWPERNPDGTIDDPTSGEVLASATAVCSVLDQFVKATGCDKSLRKLLKTVNLDGNDKRAVWEAYHFRKNQKA